MVHSRFQVSPLIPDPGFCFPCPVKSSLQLVGEVFVPREIEDGIDQYLATPIVVAGKRLITTTTAALPACVSSQDPM